MKLNIMFAVFLVMAIAAVCGCVNTAAPIPTVLSTPVPAQAPSEGGPQYPSTIGLIRSDQLTVADVKISYDRDAEKQAEVYSVLLKNNGFTWANNTIIALSITDAQTDQHYFSDQFFVGNIAPNQSKWFNMTTVSHDYAFSELVKLDWFWGDNMEFRNQLVKTYTLAFTL